MPAKKGKLAETEGDLEKGEGGDADGEEFMGNFFKEVSDTKAQLKSFQTNVKELESVYSQSLQKVAGSDKKGAPLRRFLLCFSFFLRLCAANIIAITVFVL